MATPPPDYVEISVEEAGKFALAERRLAQARERINREANEALERANLDLHEELVTLLELKGISRQTLDRERYQVQLDTLDEKPRIRLQKAKENRS